MAALAIGSNRVLTIGFLLSILFLFPQEFAPSVLFFGIFRFLTGISNAALFPSVQTLLAKGTPDNSTGMAFSLAGYWNLYWIYLR
ncbi:hypothetical protein DY138_04510 [Apilactobacillus timberlakei]|uniref:multidrug efflux MFS transporter n=1 Tax=Apilactobacillus timberlakei TaxID=2008380 RepID=UPI001125C79F|nr:multidrug efflux MFS transporter [Apilactobacillus timberlakei]TPR18882.1 hypothetical protein DY138_04510 [Apilactobacillus timberlakei]TPR20954.1 hypothetical protein DY061_02630 [Apilactobacillus timberlakei]TPR23605.1 hypothetical protein DY083_00500 [Apilactobacillus timberlakei]